MGDCKEALLSYHAPPEEDLERGPQSVREAWDALYNVDARGEPLHRDHPAFRSFSAFMDAWAVSAHGTERRSFRAARARPEYQAAVAKSKGGDDVEQVAEKLAEDLTNVICAIVWLVTGAVVLAVFCFMTYMVARVLWITTLFMYPLPDCGHK